MTTRRVVAITGGARGIGAATAAAFVADGARMAIGDLDEPVAAGTGVAAYPLDVAGPVAEEPDEDTGRTLEVNLRGTIIGTKLALRSMCPGVRGTSSTSRHAGPDRGPDDVPGRRAGRPRRVRVRPAVVTRRAGT